MIEEILTELQIATAKFPTWPTDPLHALAVLGEEFGELTKEMLQLVYEPHKTSPEHVRKEAIQTAAMALRLAMSLDRYEYRRSDQHAQQPIKTPRPAPHFFRSPVQAQPAGGGVAVDGRSAFETLPDDYETGDY